MVREANTNDLKEILELYLFLYETDIPEESDHLKQTWEKIITHKDYRGKGYATECLIYAKEIAEENECYKMMLLAGSKESKTLEFYRNAGYNSVDKTAFIQWIDI